LPKVTNYEYIVNQVIKTLECQSRLYFRKSQVDSNKIIKTTREAFFNDKMQDCDNIIKLIKSLKGGDNK
jgi:hypothetical protein